MRPRTPVSQTHICQVKNSDRFGPHSIKHLESLGCLSTMVANLSSTARWCYLLVPAVILSGNAFMLPTSIRRPRATTLRRVSPEGVVSKPTTCWGVRRRATGPCMASTSPSDPDDEAAAEDNGGKEDGADADGRGETGDETSAGGSEANADEQINGVEATATPSLSGRTDDDDDAPLTLLSHGDTLPLSYRSDNGTRESEFYVGDEKEKVNPYYDVVRRLSPTELIGRFMRTSPPRVQEAVRTTVLGLMGSLPRHAFETTAVATRDALANLMFQLQMTGYMFKNAEYRLSLQSSMRASAALPPGKAIVTDAGGEGGAVGTSSSSSLVEMDDEGKLIIARPQISGKIKLTFNADEETERAMEVDADSYMAELRGQVEQLESQLLAVQNQNEEAVQKDLLIYIKSMPEHQLQGLTAGVSADVLDSMRLLVEAVMGGMGNSEILSKTLTQQTGSGMAQLCMWQLVVGFNLREMEAREDLRKNFDK